MLCQHIQSIVDAAVRAVDPRSLLARRFSIVDGELLLDGASLATPLHLGGDGPMLVIGGGKASAGMAAGIGELLARAGIPVTGLLSVPEGCGLPVPGIEIRETRPASANVPTVAAVEATREMMERAGALGPDDVVMALVSGGGSALLAAPLPGVHLEDKVAVAKFLTGAGAPIDEINTVRQAASGVKAGGLARACGAGRMLVLVLSDVIGDPLPSIASGPCMPVSVDARRALDVLDRYGAIAAGIAPRLVDVLRNQAAQASDSAPSEPRDAHSTWTTPRGCHVEHVLLGSNATAVDAAAGAARRLGYDAIVRHASPGVHEPADQVGRRLAREGIALARAVHADGCPRAIIEGGEAVVRLPKDHGVGGRNQQTVLAGLEACLRDGHCWPDALAIASLGTDGEDGPTHAAGGLVDPAIASRLLVRRAELTRAVEHCDACPLLSEVDGLVITGPTGTNVADIRLVLAAPEYR